MASNIFNFSAFPVGGIISYAGSTAPNGWLMCDGSAISRTTYEELFSTIGTTYGSGDGSTTFNIPDLKGRTIVGVGESSATGHTAHTLGQSEGEETHTLDINEIPSHNHTSKYNLLTFGAATHETGGPVQFRDVKIYICDSWSNHYRKRWRE